MTMSRLGVCGAVAVALLGAVSLPVSAAKAAVFQPVLVAKCIASQTCTFALTPTPWSDTLTSTDLTGLGLGTSQPLDAVQMGGGFIRLGATTITFTTTTGTVTETLPAFNGPNENPPCVACLTATVGFFSIPSNATSAVIMGTFGNNVAPNSAPVDLYLGAVPLPAALPLFAGGLGTLGLLGWRRKRKAAAAA